MKKIYILGSSNTTLGKKQVDEITERECRLHPTLGTIDLGLLTFPTLPSSAGRGTLPETLIMGLLATNLVHKGIQWEVRSIFVVLKHLH